MRTAHALNTLLAALMLASCATVYKERTPVTSNGVTASMALDASPLAVGAGPGDLPRVDMIEMTPEMIAFVDQHVDRNEGRNDKLKDLADAIMGEDGFELVYDDSTSTAAGTFEKRRGNCLSFTNLFIAMARNLGLDAKYQEVEIPPDWSVAGETYLFSQHVNVNIDMKNGQNRIVDFNLYDFNTSYHMEVISDQRARAHFFNNIGAERMLAGETPQAFLNFRQSIREDASFSPAWTNLGILYRREGYPAYAETAYLQALNIDRNNVTAMSNLANLYEEEGHSELAEQYMMRVEVHRLKNPYYRFQVANVAFIEGDYRTAIENLDHAIKMRKDEDRFYFLMSLCYLMSGDKQAAQRWMKKAETIAKKNPDKEKYQHKLDILRGGAID